MRRISAVTVALLVVMALPASAGKLFLGATAGVSTIEPRALGATLDGDDLAYRYYGGWRLFRWLAVEVGDTGLGDIRGSAPGPDVDGDGVPDSLVRIDAEADARTAQGVVLLGVTPRIELFGKAGLTFWDSRRVADDGSSMLDDGDDGVDPAYGFGVNYRLGRRFWVRGEWERYELDGFDDVRYFGVGLQFGF